MRFIGTGRTWIAAEKLLISAFVIISAMLSTAFATTPINLAGEWRFALDPTNQGITGNWFDQSLKDRIQLPGILQSQGYGDEISTKTPWVLSLYDRNWFERDDYKAYTKPGNVKVPFLSQPPRHYVGPAWYQRDIDIPADWRGKRIALSLERPRWESIVWIDSKKIGSARSLVAPHEFDLGQLEPGKHRVTVRVDTTMIMPYRPDAHSVSDSLGMSWNGIVGKMELRATNKVWIEDVQVFSNKTENGYAVKAKIKIGNTSGTAGEGIVSVSSPKKANSLMSRGMSQTAFWGVAGGEVEVHIGSFETPWDEFDPKVYSLRFSVGARQEFDSREISFGIREIKAVGKEFQLNGRRIYLRGTHHGGDFPLTGYPPTDVSYWKKIFQINKDWGINHVRFHSFCPPEAAFQAADEIGIYLQPEPGMWNEVSPGTPMEKMLYEETEAMIKAYGNHPSFLLFSPSNEPKGRWKEAFDKWIAHYRVADPRRLYTNGTGHTEPSVPGLAEGTDYIAMQRVGQKMLRGNSAWFGKDYGASLDDVKIPVVSHELGQWVAYPDYSIIKKFTGYMRPGNYEIFRDSLAAKGLLARNKDFAYASGRYQLECYKEEIESNLRTPGMDGYQLLDLHDYLGQGTALVGILDAFWEEKGYATAKEFRRFNNETVPLARFNKRVYSNDETITADVELAHFGKAPIAKAGPYWRITDSMGKVVANGDLPSLAVPVGKNIPLGKIKFDPSKITEPKGLKVTVGLTGTTIENDWDLWVYPAKRSNTAISDILITHDWVEAEASLEKGGKVLYMPRKADLDWTSPPLDWVPVFWNRLMNPAWGRMLGLWIDKTHPALAGFPTDSYFDWQWTSIVNGTRAMNLDKLPKELQPIVQPIDDWNRNYKLGLVFEARVGKGRLLVSTPDLENSLSQRIAARQLRRSLLDYMATAKFDPKIAVSAANFREVFFDTKIMKRLKASTETDTPVGPNPSLLAIDGDPNTFWLAGDPRGQARQNQELKVRFPNPVQFSGIVIMPRQNGREHEGDVREYLIQISDDGTNWRDAKRGSLVSTFDPQRVDFGQNVTARFIKLTSLSGFGPDKLTAIAELAVIYTGPKLPDENIDMEYTRVRSASPDIDEGVPESKPIKP